LGDSPHPASGAGHLAWEAEAAGEIEKAEAGKMRSGEKPPVRSSTLAAPNRSLPLKIAAAHFIVSFPVAPLISSYKRLLHGLQAIFKKK
jgi:hypothetical protein